MENGKLLKGAVRCTYSTSQSRIRPSARDKDRNVLLQNLFCHSAAQVLGIVQIHICKGTWQGTSGGFVLMALTSTHCAWEPDLVSAVNQLGCQKHARREAETCS